jgi:hypothetical protein
MPLNKKSGEEKQHDAVPRFNREESKAERQAPVLLQYGYWNFDTDRRSSLYLNFLGGLPCVKNQQRISSP